MSFFISSQMQQCTSGGIKVRSWLQDALSTLEVPQLIRESFFHIALLLPLLAALRKSIQIKHEDVGVVPQC